MTLVEVEVGEAVAVVRLNRPEARNALSIEMCNSIVAALETVDRDPAARAILVSGAGSVFCAGADLAAVSADALDFVPAFERMLEAVARFRLPSIAAIQGAALGGGFQFATVCDFRIAADDARLGIPAARLGILVNFENIQRLVLLAGIARAKEVLMTARTYTGREAASAGLVQRAVPPEELAVASRALAVEIATLAPRSVQGAKKAITAVADHLAGARRSDPEAIAALDALVAEAYGSDDLAEGLRALGEKRAPDFRGRQEPDAP